MTPHSATPPLSCKTPQSFTRARDDSLWVASAAIVVALHITLTWALLRQPETAKDAAIAGAFVVELAPVAVARPDQPTVAPGPDQVQAAAAPDVAAVGETQPPLDRPAPDPIAEPMPQLVRAADPEAIPVAERDAKKQVLTSVAAPPPSIAVPTTSAIQTDAPVKGDVAAATMRGAPGAMPSIAMPRWTSKLIEQLERGKQYPPAAQGRREEGTAQVAFTIDRRGRLISARLDRSSGSEALDAEALELLQRAAPFSPPPAELKGEHISLTVPIRFRLRG